MEQENKQETRRNPLAIFVGFIFLGAALGLLLFGRDLFSGKDRGGPVIIGESSTAVLDQVSQFPELSGDDSQATNNPDDGIVSVGDEAINFTLNDLDGNLVELADFRGHPVIINFWATWCAPCRVEMPELQEAFEKYQENGLVILALDQDETAEVAREFFYDEMNLTFTPLLDEGSAVSAEYGSFGILPSTYFVDTEGIVSAVHRGPLTLGQIDGYLTQMISEQPADGGS
jgi:peroxiredoxin